MHRVINSPADLAELTALLGSLKTPFTVQWKAGRDRSLSQNDLQWKWAMEAARQRGDMTPDEVQREWKLRHGIPILRESEDFRAFYDASLKGLPYAEKIKAMDYVPVTSIMKVPEMSRFLDTVFRECVEQGIRLTVPEERKAA